MKTQAHQQLMKWNQHYRNKPGNLVDKLNIISNRTRIAVSNQITEGLKHMTKGIKRRTVLTSSTSSSVKGPPKFLLAIVHSCGLFFINIGEGIGGTIVIVLFLEFMISQSPDKMKGLVIGISIPFCFVVPLLLELINFTLCHDIITVAGAVVLFVVFLVLSKRYTLHERNREINIQAIVEEHYERYMDQEEEYMRQQHY